MVDVLRFRLKHTRLDLSVQKMWTILSSIVNIIGGDVYGLLMTLLVGFHNSWHFEISHHVTQLQMAGLRWYWARMLTNSTLKLHHLKLHQFFNVCECELNSFHDMPGILCDLTLNQICATSSTYRVREQYFKCGSAYNGICLHRRL